VTQNKNNNINKRIDHNERKENRYKYVYNPNETVKTSETVKNDHHDTTNSNNSNSSNQIQKNQIIKKLTKKHSVIRGRNNAQNQFSESSDDETESDDQKEEAADFEKNGFYVSVHCHICKEHFYDIGEYKMHLEQHYNLDDTKEWKQCDLGCSDNGTPSVFATGEDFIAHLASHSQDKPYKCLVKVHGKKCTNSSARKNNLKQHWKTHFKHNEIVQTKVKKTNAEKSNANEIRMNY